jgi:hypothetical protein
MSHISVHRPRRSAWNETLPGVSPRKRRETAPAANARQRTGDNPSAPGGGWLINRLVCAVRGHRDLVAAGTAKIEPSGVRRELFLCRVCDSFAWKRTSNKYGFSWNEVGV